MSGLLGKKLGMTQVFDESGDVVPVTVIQAGPCVVVQKKTIENDGYDAIQVGFEEVTEKRVPNAMKKHFAKRKVKPFRYLREFRIKPRRGGEGEAPSGSAGGGGDASPYEEGQVLTVESFKVGDRVKIMGVSKGKGFAGVIKRHGKAGGPASHGSRFHRTTGSIGQRTSPGEVFKNMKLPGHMGSERVTVPNVEVVQVRAEDHLLFLRGAVPGSKNNLIVIRKTS